MRRPGTKPVGAVLAAAVVGSLAIAATAYARPEATTAPAGADRAQAADAALLRCGNRARIGILAPITGQVASLGGQQLGWARYFVTRWNRFHKLKITLVQGDTQLPDTAAALRAAQQIAGNSQVLATVGPAGSQEVVVSSPPLKSRGAAFVSGSATRTSLTQEAIRKGFFYRVVPPDAIQAQSVANYIYNTLRARNVYIIDDQEAYGVGLSDAVQAVLRARGATVTRDSVNVGTATDFSSLVAKIGGGVNVVYIPWQIAAKAQLFGQQLRTQGKQAALFGSDGLFDPSTFKITGAYVSFFPVARTSSLITQYRNSHGGDAQYFGAPTYAATQVVVNAVDRACKNGTATRAEVRAQIARTNIAARDSVIGLPIRFNANGDIRGGRFGIFRVANNGAYVPVGDSDLNSPWGPSSFGPHGVLSSRMTRRRTIPPGLVSLLIVGVAFGGLLVYVVVRTDSNWALFFQLTVNGLTLGSVYALIALGYSMVYGILKLLNFAHGDVYMIGAFIGLGVLTAFGGPANPSIPIVPLLLAMFLVAMLGSGLLGVLIERVAYRPLRDAPRIAPLISALGVSFFLQNSMLLLFGAQFRAYDPFTLFADPITGLVRTWSIRSVTISVMQVIALGAAVLLMVVLTLFVARTQLGKAMRATSFDREAASMMGIDTDRVIAWTFFIGSALAGAAGVMFGLVFSQIFHFMGFLAGLKGFTAAVVGGIGSIPGAMLGGLLVGLTEAYATGYVSGNWSDLVVFSLLIIVLLVRPTGLLGSRAIQKV